MGERTIELEVLRYNPETDSEPHFQRYSVSLMWFRASRTTHSSLQLTE